jgi:two-component system, sensor histidine kinase
MSAALPLMSAKERFLSTAVHDLKNPLHSIVLFIAALKQSEDPERIAYLIDRLDRSTRGLDGLFKRLLDLSRLDLSENLPEISVFDVHALCQTLESQFTPLAERKALRFANEVNESFFVRADPVMTTEILINLLSNAFRYTTHGAVSLRGRTEGDFFRIEVCDTGQGIAPDKLDAIFEEFVQISPGARASRQGLGLGLSIVQRLAKSMGTKVLVQSQEGRGSLFSFPLPLSTEPLPKKSDFNAGEVLRGLLALVIDEDVHALTAMEALLVASGCFVLLARNLEEAEKKLEGNERLPDFLVCEAQFENGIKSHFIRQHLESLTQIKMPMLEVTKYSDAELIPDNPSVPSQDSPIRLRKPAGSTEILRELSLLMANP